jgi:hypothetical protein
MKFLIKYTENTEHRLLIYDIDEFTFDTEPSVKEINFDIVVNKINLTAIDDNRIAQVWGFCGYKEWIKSNYNAPKSKKGILKVIDDLECGFSYSVNKEDLPIYVNNQTGWVCIGNPEKQGHAVEFISNCIAVIDDNKEFLSLWLKPQALPSNLS